MVQKIVLCRLTVAKRTFGLGDNAARMRGFIVKAQPQRKRSRRGARPGLAWPG